MRRRELTMLPPTAFTLAELSAYPNVAAVVAAAQRRDIAPVLPRLVVSGDEAHLLLPHDDAGDVRQRRPVRAAARRRPGPPGSGHSEGKAQAAAGTSGYPRPSPGLVRSRARARRRPAAPAVPARLPRRPSRRRTRRRPRTGRGAGCLTRGLASCSRPTRVR